MLVITTDQSKMDIDFIHAYLSKESYWAKHIPMETVKKSIEGSLCFAVFKNEIQIGFARMITDNATFAYLCDVFISKEKRGRGYSKQLMTFIMEYPELQGLRRIMLATKDAHSLYKQFGFEQLELPERMMEIRNSSIYLKDESSS